MNIETLEKMIELAAVCAQDAIPDDIRLRYVESYVNLCDIWLEVIDVIDVVPDAIEIEFDSEN
jgi:hypothetical protein